MGMRKSLVFLIPLAFAMSCGPKEQPVQSQVGGNMTTRETSAARPPAAKSEPKPPVPPPVPSAVPDPIDLK